MAAKKKFARKKVKRERSDAGPREWLFPMLESAYTKLIPRAQAEREERRAARKAAARSAGKRAAKGAAKSAARKEEEFESTYQAGRSDDVMMRVPRQHWLDTLREYQQRKPVGRRRLAAAALAPAPAIPGGPNWTTIGPLLIERGQALGRPSISGRVAGIAISGGGQRIYVASANGGVWRSNDAGATWRSTMDSFDNDPTAFASTSQACGAIAIAPNNADRVYVGTGEGNTDSMFQQRIVNALPAYRGIGPVMSNDGGQTWAVETSQPSLAGFSFFEIAVDPANPEHCVAATTNGLYERVAAPGGGFKWVRRRTGVHCSVVVARAAGVTRFFAAVMNSRVVTSTNGTSWSTAGTGFPAANVGRIALAVQPNNPNVLYALIAREDGRLLGVRRLNNATGSWRTVSNPPPLLPGGQGDYDLCIAIDPNNVNRIYMGGDYFDDSNTDQMFAGSIWRGSVTQAGSTFSMATTSIGRRAHADVHVLVFAPGNSNSLWTGTDGGVFLNTSPGTSAGFVSRNAGLGTACTNFFSQHPTDAGVLFSGLQDNGTAKRINGTTWRHVLFADGGYCVVNWDDSDQVLLFANGTIFRATDGGLDYGSWSDVTPANAEWATMAEPLVGAPVNAAAPAQASVAALASATGGVPCVFITANFGTTWPVRVDLPAGSGSIISMIFASSRRIFLGTTSGRVFRLDQSAVGWAAKRLDNAAAGPLALSGLIWDIAVDPSDATLKSIYICFGGSGDFRHVWRFNGNAWQARSGVAGSATSLLDVEHNAIQFDRVSGKVFVGADIGAWESADGGNTWNPMSNGLPDAPVFDLQVHQASRRLRAALHGRGLYEFPI